MAFAAMESIRVAEQDAQNRIQQAIRESQQSVDAAKTEYDSIVLSAQKDAEITIAHSVQKATDKADEILVTARNKAVLDADKLKQQCVQEQDAVNKAILELII